MDKNWISVDVWIRPVFPDLVTIIKIKSLVAWPISEGRIDQKQIFNFVQPYSTKVCLKADAKNYWFVNEFLPPVYYIFFFNPLTTLTAIWRFDAITHAAIHQTHPDKFLIRFDTQCAYSET